MDDPKLDFSWVVFGRSGVGGCSRPGAKRINAVDLRSPTSATRSPVLTPHTLLPPPHPGRSPALSPLTCTGVGHEPEALVLAQISGPRSRTSSISSVSSQTEHKQGHGVGAHAHPPLMTAAAQDTGVHKLKADLTVLADAGICAIVTLQGEPLNADSVLRAGFRLDTSWMSARPYMAGVGKGPGTRTPDRTLQGDNSARLRRPDPMVLSVLKEEEGTGGIGPSLAGGVKEWGIAGRNGQGTQRGQGGLPSDASSSLGSVMSTMTSLDTVGRAAATIGRNIKTSVASTFLPRARVFKYLHVPLHAVGCEASAQNMSNDVPPSTPRSCACGVPSLDDMSEVLAFYNATCVNRPADEANTALAVHCEDGLGATGVVIASLICFRGHAKEAAQALRVLRQDRPGSCAQTEHEAAFHMWFDAWARNFSFLSMPRRAQAEHAQEDSTLAFSGLADEADSEGEAHGGVLGEGARKFVRVGGMLYPGSLLPLEEDLEFLKQQGVGAIVSVCENPIQSHAVQSVQGNFSLVPFGAPGFDRAPLCVAPLSPIAEAGESDFFEAENESDGVSIGSVGVHVGHTPSRPSAHFRYLHLPTVIMSRPSTESIRAFLLLIEAQERSPLDPSRPHVVVHCAAGQGRTGTLLACSLVARTGVRMTAEAAIAEVRRLRPGSLETTGQEQLVFEFERLLVEERAGCKPTPATTRSSGFSAVAGQAANKERGELQAIGEGMPTGIGEGKASRCRCM